MMPANRKRGINAQSTAPTMAMSTSTVRDGSTENVWTISAPINGAAAIGGRKRAGRPINLMRAATSAWLSPTTLTPRSGRRRAQIAQFTIVKFEHAIHALGQSHIVGDEHEARSDFAIEF